MRQLRHEQGLRRSLPMKLELEKAQVDILDRRAIYVEMGAPVIFCARRRRFRRSLLRQRPGPSWAVPMKGDFHCASKNAPSLLSGTKQQRSSRSLAGERRAHAMETQDRPGPDGAAGAGRAWPAMSSDENVAMQLCMATSQITISRNSSRRSPS